MTHKPHSTTYRHLRYGVFAPNAPAVPNACKEPGCPVPTAT